MVTHRKNRKDRFRDSRVCVVTSFLALVGCGGGGSQSPPPPPPQITSVTVSPATANVFTGKSQSFTAQVTGTGAFDPSVTWSVNGVNAGNATIGTIVGGEYTAPATPPNPSNVTITAASVQTPQMFGDATATIFAPTVLASITPTSASAGETITLDIQNAYDFPSVVFPGANGTSITLPLTQQSGNNFMIAVPFGATSGNVYVSITPPQGAIMTTNSVSFTRLPNLRIHAPGKDLSSGETLQFDWRLLGASMPNVVTWTADSGSVTAQGLFQAPVVSSESYSHVTGCLQNTNSCDTVLLRILPFRIGPSSPVVSAGNTIQLEAIQGESFLSPQWSVLAGGGSITSAGLFTAPTAAARAGPVPIGAISTSTTEQTSVGVSGTFAGLVNRVYDYADFATYTPKEANYFRSVAVSGNRAYVLALKSPYQTLPTYEALDVYDISNPDQPVWVDSVEAATNSPPSDLFVYGNALFILDSSTISSYSLTTQPPSFVGTFPIPTAPFVWTFNSGVLYVVSNVYGVSPTTPIDLYDLTSGTPIHKHYELPTPEGATAISGGGNIVYISNQTDANDSTSFSISTFDVSQSPPALLGTVVSTTATALNLQVVGNLLFADSQVYDISNVTPVLITTLPLPLLKVWDAQGNYVLVSGGTELDGTPNFAVVDISSPSSPVVYANVSDLMSWDLFNPFRAAWATNERFYVTDGTGGLAVYNASPGGGPNLLTSSLVFSYIYDQVLQQQTLYEAAVYGSGAGGLACFDVSGATPSLLGSLMYPNDSSFALQSSGTTVYVGMADSLKVMDASNPQAPSEIASVAIPVNALALSGNTLFAGTGDGRLVVFDVSTPASPKQIGSTTMPVPNTIRLSGTLLLVAAEQNGFLVFDVSNPSAPVMLSQFTPSVSAPIWDVAPIGNSAVILAADISGIVTVDISNPSQPKQLYQAHLPYIAAFPPSDLAQAAIASAFSLATQGGLTYVGTTNSMLFAYDASIAAMPRLMAMNVVATGSVYTSYAQGMVAAISPGTNTLYLAVEGGVTKMDNSIPENSIELYYQPDALELPVPVGDAAKSNRLDRNPKKNWMGKRSDMSPQNPNRFGVAPDGHRKQSVQR